MSIIMNSFLVVVGNTYNINNTLKTYGFKFMYAQKAWYKLASKETTAHWEKQIGTDSISVGHVESLDKINTIVSLHKECMDLQKQCAPKKEITDSIDSQYTGQVLELSKWYASQFAQDKGVSVPFRNMKVLAVYRETEKAIFVDVEFFAGVSVSCGVCGLALSNAVSKATGIGPVCSAKMGFARVSKVNAKEIIEALDKKCAQLGVFKECWIPKSQIRRVVDLLAKPE